MRIKVVTDSACDVPEELINQFNITVIPNYINIGDLSFRDGVDITRNQFYESLPTYPHHPKTAAPGPELFGQAYQHAANQGYDHIISIHVAGNLSSTYQSSIKASSEVKIPVTVHDTQQLSLGAGLQVILASKMAVAGENVKDIKQKINDLGNRTYIYALLDTLKFLHLSGRINFALRGIGSILRIKPLMIFHAGIPIYEKVRTRGRAIERILTYASKLGPLEHVSMVHSQAIDGAKWLYDKAASLIPENNQPYCQTVNPEGVY